MAPSPDLLELDRRHVWHPYAPMPAPTPPLEVIGAEGVRLRLAGGRELIDGMSSWWCAVHGYRHPALDAAVRGQLERMSHVMFGGLTHEPGVRLAERLVALTPAPLQHVFFSDSGSVAVEVALKLCLQARPGRSRVLTVRGGYHGDTFGAMAVCDPVGGMHSLFAGALAEHVFADRPPRELDAAYERHVTSLVDRHAHELAAVIVEPVVQGAGGMWFYDPAVLRLLRKLCDDHGLLLVFDEIATGFGRTGALFACEHAGVAPDVLCLGKALTGGYITLAATLCTTAVADRLEGGALMHGPTYMANPLACSVALASTGLIAQGGWRADVARIERALREGLEPAREQRGVVDVRVLGAIGVIQLDGEVDVAAATRAAVARGVWLRPFRDLIYTMPPYITGDEDLARVTEALRAAAAVARPVAPSTPTNGVKNMHDVLVTAREQVLERGEGLTEAQVLEVLRLPDERVDEALGLAHEVRMRWCGPEVEVEGIVSLKTGGCPEDCHFCSQSGRFETPVRAARLDIPSLVEAARQTAATGATEFCIVAAVRGPDDRLMAQVRDGVAAIRAEVDINVACSLGILTPAQADELQALGVHRYNHNLETARSYFSSVVTTHTWEERRDTLRLVRERGMEVCCGCIIGMGETLEQRAELAAQLGEVAPDEVPMNFLDPRPGTPFANLPVTEAPDALRAIAAFRLALPRTILRFAGGRELTLGDLGARQGVLGGINAVIVGNYLTTLGRDPQQDLDLLAELSMPVKELARTL